MNDSDIFNLYLEALKVVGPASVVLIVLSTIIISIILLYFNQRLKNIANEISEKSIILFKSKIELISRDEQI